MKSNYKTYILYLVQVLTLNQRIKYILYLYATFNSHMYLLFGMVVGFQMCKPFAWKLA